MQRIALVSEHASPLAPVGSVDSGGQNVYVASVARELVKHGVAVDVFTRRDNSLRPTVVETMPRLRVIHVEAGPPVQLPKESLIPYMPAFANGLSRWFGDPRLAYDCVHANFFMSAWAGLRAARPLGIPLVTTFHALGRVRRLHQGDADAFPDARFAMEDEAVRHSTRLVAECVQDQRDLLDHYDADVERIDIVPCGVDAAEFEPMDRGEARRLLGWERDAFIVLQLGRIVPRKGIETVVEAIGLLRSRHAREAHCYVVGGNSEQPSREATPEIGRLADRATELGVADLVHFVGRRGRRRLAACFSACDVFVTTPWYEPFGITPLEAMACAVPVIGSAVGGIRTTVVDGVTGFHVAPRDASDLAQRLVDLMQDPELRQAMGEAGRRRALGLYTWSHVAQQLVDVYRRACRDEGVAADRDAAPVAAGKASGKAVAA